MHPFPYNSLSCTKAPVWSRKSHFQGDKWPSSVCRLFRDLSAGTVWGDWGRLGAVGWCLGVGWGLDGLVVFPKGQRDEELWVTSTVSVPVQPCPSRGPCTALPHPSPPPTPNAHPSNARDYPLPAGSPITCLQTPKLLFFAVLSWL